MTMSRKQPKKNKHQLNKSVIIANFECLEKAFNDENNNIRVEKTVKPPSIFVDKVSNLSSLSQLLKKIATDKYEIKIMNEQTKIQPKSSIAYINIVKELKNKNTEFHTYKPKQERSFKVVLKYIHAIANPDDIKKEIEDLKHIITNIYIYYIKKQDTKRTLHMFYLELEPKSNNKDIYEVGSLLDCRVKFEAKSQM